MEAVLTPALFCAGIAFACWAVSVVTKNYSQVDRMWSLTPPLYIGLFAYAAAFASPRLNLMMLLAMLWGARLTYNFARKGGYKRGGEDYRWPVLRARMGGTLFQVFNVFFIAGYQNLLLLLISLPAFVALQHRSTPLAWLDALSAGGFLLFLVGETIADEQQWRFHLAKHARQQRGEAVDPPFLTTGLFRYSRHPNFFCEQAMWWCMYGFSVAASGEWLTLGLVGPVLLTLLFQGSTAFTERLSLQKYPSYAEYQRTTSRLLPLP